MATFSLDGQDVGARVVAAINRAAAAGEPILLSCRRTRFRDRAVFAGAAFAELKAEDAIFEKGLEFEKCVLGCTTHFDRVQARHLICEDSEFSYQAYFRGLDVTEVRLAQTIMRAYTSFDESRLARCSAVMLSLQLRPAFAKYGVARRLCFEECGSRTSRVSIGASGRIFASKVARFAERLNSTRHSFALT